MTFPHFFQAATDNPPYDYQSRLAGGDPGTECRSQLINIPTGLGKTAAVVLAWLWNRVAHPNEAHKATWPRRLVYCLPMRTLVEQTEREVSKWVKAHGLLWNGQEPRQGKVGVHVLMGGEDAGEWDIYPEENAILIGTQDMLLSRALNRGYGMSRYRWPMHFGLLNNDCLWIMDETQLMGPGLATACQLEAFRRPPSQGFGAYGGAGSVTWYMSATSNSAHLTTRDWRDVARPAQFQLGLSLEEREASSGPIHQRRFASKRLIPLPRLSFTGGSSKGLVTAVLRRHRRMVARIATVPDAPARTLIICNTVNRAEEVYRQLKLEIPRGCDLVLLHSRFRAPERRENITRLRSANGAELRTTFPNGQIVVSTQVIEAGVDISSGVLWSEVAPLASLVQRLGRLNRAGEFNGLAWAPKAFVVGLGLRLTPARETKEQKEQRDKANSQACLPYDLASCDPESQSSAWRAFKSLRQDACPANLETIQSHVADSIPRCPYSLLRHELLDFFDTDANLSLGFTDVSPFVRGLDEDTDLTVLWRESWVQEDGAGGIGKPGFTPDYQRRELCSIPVGNASQARDVLNQGWIWRGKDTGWISVRDAGFAPGMTILLPVSAGGYDNNIGWTGNPADKHFGQHYEPSAEPSDEEQLSSLANGWQSIAAHTEFVARELAGLLQNLLVNEECERNALTLAVTWHDIGKNHPGWQHAVIAALKEASIAGSETHQPYAKFSLSESPLLRDEHGQLKYTGRELARELKRLSRHFRPAIAHEVASALAFRHAEQQRLGTTRDTDRASLLAEYVIMSHHGRVRKVLRDEIPKFPDNEKDASSVRGIREGDHLLSVEVAGRSLGCDSLSTDCRKMGRAGINAHESYTRGVLRLLEIYGPFRLAFYETLFRAADARASRSAASHAKPVPPLDVSSDMELREDSSPYRTGDNLSAAEQSLVADLVADGLSIQGKFRPEPLYKQTGKGHYESKTVDDMREAKEKGKQP